MNILTFCLGNCKCSFCALSVLFQNPLHGCAVINVTLDEQSDQLIDWLIKLLCSLSFQLNLTFSWRQYKTKVELTVCPASSTWLSECLATQPRNVSRYHNVSRLMLGSNATSSRSVDTRLFTSSIAVHIRQIINRSINAANSAISARRLHLGTNGLKMHSTEIL